MEDLLTYVEIRIAITNSIHTHTIMHITTHMHVLTHMHSHNRIQSYA